MDGRIDNSVENNKSLYKLIYIGFEKNDSYYVLGNSGLLKVSRFIYSIYLLINNVRTVNDICKYIRQEQGFQKITDKEVEIALQILENNGIITRQWRNFC